MRFIDPGRPVQNACTESFNGRLRGVCRNQHWFLSLADARWTIEAWRRDYNETRPHTALGCKTPAEFHHAHMGVVASTAAAAGFS